MGLSPMLLIEYTIQMAAVYQSETAKARCERRENVRNVVLSLSLSLLMAI